jgi:hypothetical protein
MSMFVSKKALPRRAFLRGAGGSLLALPLLDAMVPALTAFDKTPAKPVRRLGFVYIPNGVRQDTWWPKDSANGQVQLPYALSPLEKVKDQLTVFRGLEQHQAEGLGDGNAEHTRASSVWLNGVHPKLTEGADVQAGITADQVAANVIGKDTQLRSLELALEPNFMVGNCNDGYSCVYMNTFVWRTATMPLPMENNPRVVFERLFGLGGTTAERLAELRTDRSILDSVNADMARLQKKLGPGDRLIASEYLDAVRDVEQRVRKSEALAGTSALPDQLQRPTGIPDDFDEHAKLMLDLQWLALRADITRVITMQMAREFSSRSYLALGVTDGHHAISHHNYLHDRLDAYGKINRYHVSLLAYLMEKLQATPEGDGTMLDNTMYLYGGGISDGDLHDHVNLPTLLIGGGTRQHEGGRYLKFREQVPMNNLLLGILDRANVPLDQLGDSTGRLQYQGEPVSL